MPDSTPNKFNDFIILQAQNAGLFLGQLPHPSTGKAEVNLPAAHSVIQSLEMLKEKTQGNLTNQEIQLLGAALENLQKLYTDLAP